MLSYAIAVLFCSTLLTILAIDAILYMKVCLPSFSVYLVEQAAISRDCVLVPERMFRRRYGPPNGGGRLCEQGLAPVRKMRDYYYADNFVALLLNGLLRNFSHKNK